MENLSTRVGNGAGVHSLDVSVPIARQVPRQPSSAAWWMRTKRLSRRKGQLPLTRARCEFHRSTRASTSTMSHQPAVSRGLPQTAPGLGVRRAALDRSPDCRLNLFQYNSKMQTMSAPLGSNDPGRPSTRGPTWSASSGLSSTSEDAENPTWRCGHRSGPQERGQRSHLTVTALAAPLHIGHYALVMGNQFCPRSVRSV